MSPRLASIFPIIAALVGGAFGAAAQAGLFNADRLNKEEGFVGIEGPAVDGSGTLYFVHFVKKNGAKIGRINRVKPGAGKSEPFAVLTGGSLGNGIRFDRDGQMFVADWVNHNVLVFAKGATTGEVYFGTPPNAPGAKFNQPNDLAIDKDGTLYASDPLRKKNVPLGGQVWRITRGPDGKGRGEIMQSSRPMSVPNGIDLSPDGTILYVSESVTREVWAYRIEGTRLTATATTPLKKFDCPSNAELDGLRTDAAGRIFVARPRAAPTKQSAPCTDADARSGSIAVLDPAGTLLREIKTKGRGPSNLTFGGPDGKTVYVTQSDGGFVETFRVDSPGREPCLQFGGAFC